MGVLDRREFFQNAIRHCGWYTRPFYGPFGPPPSPFLRLLRPQYVDDVTALIINQSRHTKDPHPSFPIHPYPDAHEEDGDDRRSKQPHVHQPQRFLITNHGTNKHPESTRHATADPRFAQPLRRHSRREAGGTIGTASEKLNHGSSCRGVESVSLDVIVTRVRLLPWLSVPDSTGNKRYSWPVITVLWRPGPALDMMSPLTGRARMGGCYESL